MKPDLSYKVLMVGDTGVGKSSIILRIQRADVETHPTVVHVFSRVIIKDPGRNRHVELSIWDLAGSEQYKSTIVRDFHGADFAVLVCDLTNTGSFNSLPDWVDLVEKHVQETPTYVVVGNKVDLETDRIVDSDSIAEYAGQIGAIAHIETSAVTAIGVFELLEAIAQSDQVPIASATSLTMIEHSEGRCC
jgi:small GTP-binding protein